MNNKITSGDTPILWYFADPMCSWCWGFSPIIQQIKKNYQQDLKIALVMGGLQAGETSVLSESSREEILHHWREVNKMTGQSFSFESALANGFIYNTEPACRAVITAGFIDASKTFEYLNSVQSAFYTENKDVTQPDILFQLAEDHEINISEFTARFESEAQKKVTLTHFEQTRQAGVQGFPTLILNNNKKHHVLTRGYQSYEVVSENLDNILSLT